MSGIFETKGTFGSCGRSGILKTRAGEVQTPTFMPDGTRGAVKGLTPQQVIDTGVEIVLANTYHLHLAPGEKVIKELGGLHAFANRKGPMLTDSGGFQVFSLGTHAGRKKQHSSHPRSSQAASDSSFSQSRSKNYALSKEDVTDADLKKTSI